MIHELDETIKALLEQQLPQVRDRQVEIAFEQPNREWSGKLRTRAVLNFFLYDIRENPVLRQHHWQTIQDSHNGAAGNDKVRQKRTPFRVDCFYLVTAWSGDADTSKRPGQEHRLLSECLMALARYPILNQRISDQLVAGRRYMRPGEDNESAAQQAVNTARQKEEDQHLFPFLVGALANDEHEIRTRLAHHDVMTNPAELWGSLDNDIRAGFSYVVNLPLDPWQEMLQQTGEVGTVQFRSAEPLPETEETLPQPARGQPQYELPTLLGGTVKQLITKVERQLDGSEQAVAVVELPYAGVEVWLVERGRSIRTDSEGRFAFRRIPAGDYTLEVRVAESQAQLHRQRVTISADPTRPTRAVVIRISSRQTVAAQ